jgi:polyisoprenoid-binding protein YceI
MLKRIIMSVLVGAAALPVAANEFEIDSVHSSVGFAVDHMVVSTVRGSFGGFGGTISLDSEDLTKSSVEVKIDAASIDTANEQRDEHLRSADFFDAENHPEITFKSGSIKKDGDRYVAVGNLTIRGNTRLVELPFTVKGPIDDPWGNRRIGVRIEPITIDRKEFGLTWSKALETGGLVVGDEVTIELAVAAVSPKDESGS